MMILDGTIVNVALPAIQESLGLSSSNLGWVVNAYLIPFGGLLLLSGRLGDLFGRKGVFLTGVTIFTAASLACGLASNTATLLTARFAQGAGAAIASSVTLGMVVTMYTDSRQRAKAIGVYSFVQSAGGTLGLLFGGVLAQTIGWHWIFLVNLPIGILTVIAASRVLRTDTATRDDRAVDGFGAALITLSMMAGVYAIAETSRYGFGSIRTTGVGLMAIGLLVCFVIRQAKVRDPLLPFRMFAIRNVSGALATHTLMIAGIFSFQFLAVLYMQNVLGFDQVRTGLGVVPVSVLIGAMSLLVAPRLIARFTGRVVLLVALASIAAGLATLSRISAAGTYLTDVFPATLLLGVGFGLAMPALAGLAMSAATPQDSGLASGMFNTVQQIGSSLGLAILSTLAASHTDALRARGATSVAALTGGYQLAFGVAACFVVVAWIVAATVIRTPRVSPVAP
ncbi:MFS transporter [Nocardia panacis]|uniref:MFS transporter n=2 Tax=Nocardia panacis TaxID=2340916 RepID=A0A3A4KLC6_9NOCA|nr:MFS transporter [Nocardia panacis]